MLRQHFGGVPFGHHRAIASCPQSCRNTSSRKAPLMDQVSSLVVVGAHLRGQPLNHQLTELGAYFARACRTAPYYALYALPGHPPKPGMVRVSERTGRCFEVEIWNLPRSAFGDFIASVLPPLCIGTIELEDGATSLGFLCEGYAAATADDISHHAGWRDYLAHR
jgi:allophanate hydrolase